MKLHNSNSDIFVPDGLAAEAALARTTHLCVSAHQDDIELMAYRGVAECFSKEDKWFTGVVVTNGAGSPRSGAYANYTDDDMQKIRLKEQRKAAYIGDYAAQLQLGYTSGQTKDPKNADLAADLKAILLATKPEIIYIHNLADKHDTHVASALRMVKAIRGLRGEYQPKKLYGCEVWRSLDWVNDDEKVVLPTSAFPNMASALVEVFDSQITGGKRYDLAAIARRVANATYYASHSTDFETHLNYAMDLTPLVENPELPIAGYVTAYIDHLKSDVESRLSRMS